jgi:flagellar motor switch protein FliM
MAPLPGRAILEINPNIAFAVIDRVTGGRGESGDKLRELTDIEKALLTKIYQVALHDYEESWKDLVNLNPRLEGVTSTMLFTQVASPGDMVMVASCEIKLANTTGMMSVCVPVTTIEPLISKLSTELCMGGAKRNTSDQATEDLSQNLSRMPMMCSAVLGATTVTIGDLVNLAVGDVVRLNTNVRSDLTFAVGEHGKFYCKPGLVGSRLAVQITKVDEDAAGTEVA